MVVQTRNRSNGTSTTPVGGPAKPWHLWLVGVVSLLWNGSGAYTIMMAQAGKLANVSAEEAAYYAAQPFWLVVVTDIALLAAVVGAVALLLRSRAAVSMFALSLLAIVIANLYDLTAETPRMMASRSASVVTAVIFVVAVLELAYAWRMKTRQVLR